MYKIMLVEDEAIIRRGIKRGVKWEENGFEIAAEAEDGEEALKLLEETGVDVILTDVKMPGMNGVELSKKVKEQYPQIEIVILSGFAEFEYAKAAVSFGAFEYMVKPVRKQEIEAVFGRLKEKLDRRSREEAEEQHRMLVLNEGMEKLRETLLLELLEGERKAYTNLEEEIMRLELELSTRNVQAAVIRTAVSQDAETEEIKQAYRKILREYVPDGVSVIRSAQEMVLVFSDLEMQRENLLAVNLKRAAEKMKEECFGEARPEVRVGIGMIYPSITHLYKSYAQAKKAIDSNFHEAGQIVNLFRDGIEYEFEKQWIQEYPREISSITELVLAGKEEEVRSSIEKMFAEFEHKKMNPELIKNYCYVLGIMLKNAVYGILKPAQEQSYPDGSFETRVKNVFSMEELKEIMQRAAGGMVLMMKENGVEEPARDRLVIGQAKAYIAENYSKKISLDEICRNLYLSTTYFSFIFKKETGQNYMEYLTGIRMEKAKELLGTTTKKVYEIAGDVGYSDYKYFTAQFKKYTGMSPKDYRLGDRAGR